VISSCITFRNSVKSYSRNGYDSTGSGSALPTGEYASSERSGIDEMSEETRELPALSFCSQRFRTMISGVCTFERHLLMCPVVLGGFADEALTCVWKRVLASGHDDRVRAVLERFHRLLELAIAMPTVTDEQRNLVESQQEFGVRSFFIEGLQSRSRHVRPTPAGSNDSGSTSASARSMDAFTPSRLSSSVPVVSDSAGSAS